MARLTLDDYQFDSQAEFTGDPQGVLVKTLSQRCVWMPGGMMRVLVTVKRLAFDLFLGIQYQLPTPGPPLRSLVAELMSLGGSSGPPGGVLVLKAIKNEYYMGRPKLAGKR